MNIINLTRDFIKNNFDQFKEVTSVCKYENVYPWTIENYLYELPNKWLYSIGLLSENNILLGFIIASEKIVNNVHIHKFYTRPEYRNQKIGSRLFIHLYNKAKNNQIKALSIAVYQNNKIAYDFYKKLGFANEQIIKVDNDLNDTNILLTNDIHLINVPKI